MGEVRDEGALVNEQAGKNGMAPALEGGGLPPEFARVGDDPCPDGEVGDLALDHAGREQVKLDAAGGVPGVGPAVDLEDHRNGRGRAGELADDLGDEAALALVAEGNAHVGDEATGKRRKGHG